MKVLSKRAWLQPMTLALTVLATAAAIAAVGCGSVGSETEDDVIKIGVTTPLSGRGADFGELQKNGVTLAADHINAEGGIDGTKVELVIEDTDSDPTTAAQATRKLIQQDQVHAIVSSPVSLETLAQLPVANSLEVPVVDAVAVAEEISDEGGDWLAAKLNVSDTYNDRALATYITKQQDLKRVAFLAENSDYGKPPVEAAAEVVEANGATVTAMEYFNPGASNVTAQLGTIARSEPDAFMIHALPTEAPTIVRQRLQTGLRGVPLFVNAGQGSPTFIEQSGDAAEGAISVINWEPAVATGGLGKKVVEDYTERFGNPPNQYAVEPYDAIRLIAWAAGRSGVEPEALRDEIRNANGDFEGVISDYTFNDEGAIVLPEYIMEVRNGAWEVTDQTIQPSEIED